MVCMLGNNKGSMESLADTFLLSSNIVPQDLDNNISYWHRLELFTRHLTKAFDEVWVLSGPAWVASPKAETSLGERKDSSAEVDSTARRPQRPPKPHLHSVPPLIKPEHLTITHEVIGKNGVHVPTHLFKSIVASKSDGEKPLILRPVSCFQTAISFLTSIWRTSKCRVSSSSK